MRAIFISSVLIVAAAVPVRAQNCQAVPEQARPSQAALDSTRAQQGVRGMLEDSLRAAARAAGIAQPRGIVMAQLQGRGEPRVWSYRSNLPDGLSRAVLARNTEALTRWSRRDGLVNLRLDHLPAPNSVTRECMPVLQDPQFFARELARIQAGPRTGTQGGSRRILLYLTMLVTRDGEVAYAELRRPSINGDVDRGVLQLARRLRFRPAMIETVPVDVWVEQPLDLTVANE